MITYEKAFLLVAIAICYLATIFQSFDPKLNVRFNGPDGNRMIAVACERGNPGVAYSVAGRGAKSVGIG